MKDKMTKLTRLTITIAILALTITLFGCGNTNTSSSQLAKGYYSFTDDLENEITLTKPPKKVVSLLGSYSEMWLLAGGELAGVTEDAVSERGINLSKDVTVIGSVKAPSTELLLSITPDLVLLSTDIDSHVKLSNTLKSAGITCAYFKEDSIDDYLNMLKILTSITQKPDLYERYGDSVKKQVDKVVTQVKDQKTQPKVLLIRSMSTKAKALKEDHMVGVMLKDLNADNIASRHESLLEDLSMETIIQEDPDIILIVTMGDVDKAKQTLENGIMKNKAWKNLSAVKNNRVEILPKDLFQYKPNARWGESYEYLKKILYP